RAARVEAVVREREAAGRRGHQGRAPGPDQDRAARLDEDVRPLDGENPAMVHLPSALVGPSHPGLVLPARPQRARLAGGPDGLSHLRRPGATGHRRARYLVLVWALAVFDARV